MVTKATKVKREIYRKLAEQCPICGKNLAGSKLIHYCGFSCFLIGEMPKIEISDENKKFTTLHRLYNKEHKQSKLK